ncbi:SDR family NAD(P)-dependent oxidoreductase [Paenibacillus sp. MMS18-CY102]|uniref:SDR family NAD(P)-dependent oxidoreductase n=1 Tax=Paenibacillus sp. MMS18-CY102 TaxID=2682849 RepID=UPI0013667083|nr:SDR family oxidoreductase [Paenibacillus sp. MMS18-CY102]MWC29288.1 SDR family oxidoreductase [Paenibacillus sp. MMS18-CY102]
MDLGLQGKVALITGGSQGIGFASAIALAKEGAQVAIVARSEDRLRAAAAEIVEHVGVAPIIIAADVSSPDDCTRAVEETFAHYGRIDILVNNAGTSAAGSFETVTADAWAQDLDLKLFGAIHCSRAAVAYMRKAGTGSIVNVTAVGGKTPSAGSLPTSVSRAAGLALTKAMSKDLAPAGIRVNAVCIGLIRSEQIERMWQKTAPEQTWEQFALDGRFNIPLGRIGDAREAANVIAFLSSSAASYVTGTAVNIDGGTSAVL